MKVTSLYTPTEDQIQEAVVEWCDLMRIPIVHIPNEGARSAAYGERMKRMGLRKGFPDLFVTEPRGGYHGLFIELKAPGGRTSADQKKWVAQLNARGYLARVCVGSDAAITLIQNYMENKRDESKLEEITGGAAHWSRRVREV